MEKVDFIGIATFCAKRAKEKHPIVVKTYERTFFVSISEDNVVNCSSTPHILQDAHLCVLMHEYSEIPISNIYYWYEFEIINSEGCVIPSDLENDYNLISYKRKQSSPFITLRYKDQYLYHDADIKKIWKLYSIIKNILSESERNLIINLFGKDDKILELERQIEDHKFTEMLLKQERDQYKDLLDEIKNLVKSKE